MIKIYKFNSDNQDFEEISQGTFANPATVKSTPGGTAIAQKLWIRNDDSQKYYTDISIQVPSNPDEVPGDPVERLGLRDLSLKILTGDAEPTDAEWAAATPWPTLTSPVPANGDLTRSHIPNLGAAGSPDVGFYPFWMRISCPGSIKPGEKLLHIKASYTEGVV